jgi:peptidoglycan hydrolase CwlO-like protein
MANEFVARNGLIAQDSSTISGSLIVTNGVTGSLLGTSSYANNADTLDGLDSSVFTSTSSFQNYTSSANAGLTALNAQTASLLNYTSSNSMNVAALFAASASLNASVAGLNTQTASLNASVASLNAQTASLLNYTSSNAMNIASLFATSASLNANVAGLNLQTASLLTYTSSNNTTNNTQNTRLSALEAATSSIYNTTASLNASVASLNSYTSSTDAKIASIYSTTSSLNTRVGILETYTSSLNNRTSSFATTGSNTFNGTQTITGSILQSGNFTSTGTITAQTLIVQTITSSQDFVTGSTRFGTLTSNTHQFTGSVSASGSLNINNSVLVADGTNVGIGSASPGYKLDVAGTVRTTGNTILASSGNYVSIGGAPFYAGTSVGSLSIRGDLYPGIAFFTGSNSLDQVGQIFSYAGAGTMILSADPRGVMSSTTMQFEIDGDTKMLLNSSGNLGIGTTNPTTKLHVSGTTGGVFEVDGASAVNALYVSASGFVGIGTIAPNSTLQVSRGGVTFQVTDTNKTANNTFSVYGLSQTSWAIATGNSGSFSGGEKIVLLDNGNVGIGTTSPSVRLDVRGNMLLKGDATDGGILTITRRYSTGPQTINFNNNHPSTNLDWTGARITSADANSYNGYLDFQVSLGNNANEAAGTAAVASVMRLTKDRNVGIGTTAPESQLSGTKGLSIVDGTNAALGLSNGTNHWLNYLSGTTYRIWNNSVNEVVTILLNGNVGIATTSPSYTLQVGQNTTGNNVDYGISISRHGSLSSSGTYTTSSAFVISELSNAGPSTVDNQGIFQLSFGRYSETMTNAANASLMFVGYDGQWGPFRMDGRGNSWIGYDRTNLPTNSGTFGLLVRNGISVGNSYQSTTPPSNGAIIQGNVGIGTTSPSSLLQVGSTAVSSGGGPLTVYGFDGAADLYTTRQENNFNAALYLHNNPSGAVGNGTGILFRARSSSTDSRVQGAVYTSWTTSTDSGRTSKLVFQTVDSGTNSDKVTILGNGNVGIGTTAPSFTLDVTGTGRFTSGYLGGGGSITSAGQASNTPSANSVNFGVLGSTYSFIDLATQDNFGGWIDFSKGNGTDYSGRIRYWNVDDRLEFYTSASASPRMSVSATGNVGIGTTAPSANLHVFNSATTGYLRVGGGNGSGNSRIFIEAAGNNSYIDSYGDDAYKPLQINASTLSFNGGNVGIGTTSPIGKQHNVIASNGTALFLNNSTGGSGAFVDLDFGTYTTAQSGYANAGATIRVIDDGDYSGHITFRAKGNSIGASQTERVRIQSNGNVGIGTTSPNSQLQVGNVNTSGTGITIAARYDQSDAFLRFRTGHGSVSTVWEMGNIAMNDDGNFNGIMHFRTATVSAATPTTKMVIKANGSVGIGTTSPGQLLHVAGFTRTHGISLNDGTVAGFIGYEKSWLGSGSNDVAIASEGGNNIRFYTNGTTSVRMMINTNGNVGIGTTSPSNLLNILAGSGTASGTTVFRIGGPSNYESLEFGTINTYDAMIRTYGNDLKLYSGHWRTNGEVSSEDHSIYFYTSKNGSSNWSEPKMRLDHNGTLTVINDVIAYGSPSDIAFKTNIKPLEGALEKLMKLRGVSFTWKEDTNEHKMVGLSDDIGFIAQEVQEILPEIVRKSESGFLSLRDKGIIPILVEAIKELKAEIDILKQK